MVPDRCRGSFDETEYRMTVAAAGQLYPDLEAVNSVADESTGFVSYGVGWEFRPYIDQPWMNENSWRWDAC